MLEALPEHVLDLLGLQADLEEGEGLLRSLPVKTRDGLLVVGGRDLLEDSVELGLGPEAKCAEGGALRPDLRRDAAAPLRADED